MKKTHLAIYPLLLFVAVLFSGCTQPNGHIGKLFGSWSLVDMTCDGQAVSLPDGAIGATASFQSSVTRFSLIYNVDEQKSNMCSWVQTDDTLTFNFNHSSDDSEAGTGLYTPPAWTHFEGLTVRTTIVELKARTALDQSGRKNIQL